MLEFKAKEDRNIETQITNWLNSQENNKIFVVCQQNAWNDSVTMLKWIHKIYRPYIHNRCENLLAFACTRLIIFTFNLRNKIRDKKFIVRQYLYSTWTN